MNTIIKLLAFTLIFMFCGLDSAVYAYHGDDVHPADSKIPIEALEFLGSR